MERPTTEIGLPISGIKAIIFSYYTRGERKEIESVMLESAEFEQIGGKPKLKKVDATYRSKMEDKSVLLAVKHLLDIKGNEIKLTQKVLDEMPESDFILLQEAMPKGKTKKK